MTRTAITDAVNTGRQSFFESDELKGFVLAFEYSAILDDRTSEICRSNDGRIRKDWGNRQPPNHFRCRSVLVAVSVVDDWDGKQDKKLVAGEPADGFK